MMFYLVKKSIFYLGFAHRSLLLCSLILALLPSILLDQSFGQKPTKNIPLVTVTQSQWGDVSTEEISAVLQSTANQLFKETSQKKWSPILVSQSKAGPIVFFKKGKNKQHIVHLKTKGRYWCQYVFQFAHELGHILCGYNAINKKHLWFEETICEMASLTALKKLSKEWMVSPPYPHLRSFAPEFDKYAKKRISSHSFPENIDFSAWYQRNKLTLETVPLDYERNVKIAGILLSVFEENPILWESCEHLSSISKSNQLNFEEYLKLWLKKCSGVNAQKAVREIAIKFDFVL